MSFLDVINELKNNSETYSAYRRGIEGVVQIIDGKIVFRNYRYEIQPLKFGVTFEDISAEDWQIAVKVD